jgi:hypothetical protein
MTLVTTRDLSAPPPINFSKNSTKFVIFWGSTGGGVSKGHFTENVHKTLSRPALRSFYSLKTYFFLEEGVSTIMLGPLILIFNTFHNTFLAFLTILALSDL